MKRVATKIASKTKDSYSKVVSLISVRLSFNIQKSAVHCLRGAHTKKRQPPNHNSLEEIEETFNSVPADVLLRENVPSFSQFQ